MQKYIHAVTSSTLAWAGNIYDLVLITYAYDFLHKYLGLSYFELTLLFSLGLIGRVIGASIFGKIADTKGRKNVALIGTAGYSISQFLFAFSTFFPLMALIRLVEGSFMGAQWTAGTVIAIEQAPKNKIHLINSIVQAGYAVGYALTGVTYFFLSSSLDNLAGYRIFMLTGSIPLIIVPYIYFKVTENFKPSKAEKINVKDYKDYLIKASLAMSGMFIAYLSVFSIYPNFAEFEGFSPSYVGILMAVANGLQALSYVFFGKISSIISTFKLIYLGIGGLIIAVFLSMPIISFLHTISIMSAGVYLYAFTVGFWPLISGIVASSVPSEVRAFITGTSYNIGAVSGGIVSALLGVIIAVYGMKSLPYFVVGINFASLAIVFISMYTWPRSNPVAIGRS
ncbi:MFS transporter [Acidianus sulfidivorans JP7]|uniref:MFS transporter n=1 Tax=Acidianus sulfidivorans TaxID=312539 RepID=UPI001442F4B8|nr:MFS transporter [Acidianus sulfidivorans]AWR96830.2 MFS transporter [Acidianus sulfidivorans JP7]